MEKLYCMHCDKRYDVAPEEIALMLENGRTVEKEKEAYVYGEGCFFKQFALLKRQREKRVPPRLS